MRCPRGGLYLWGLSRGCDPQGYSKLTAGNRHKGDTWKSSTVVGGSAPSRDASPGFQTGTSVLGADGRTEDSRDAPRSRPGRRV